MRSGSERCHQDGIDRDRAEHKQLEHPPLLICTVLSTSIFGTMDSEGADTFINRTRTGTITELTADDNLSTRKKKFLFRVIETLHSAGNLTYKTEKSVKRLARKLDLFATCSISPLSVIISFNTSSLQLNPKNSEVYTFSLTSGLDCSKLQATHQLLFDIESDNIDFMDAEIKLAQIEYSPQLYSNYIIALAYGASSFSNATFFFGGSWLDGCWAFAFGIVTYLSGVLCGQIEGLSEIEFFVTSTIVTVLTTFLDKYVYDGWLCVYAVLFGGIAWLLPGITITVALLEMYSKMITYGSSRLIHGVTQATQLGFGFAIGCSLVRADSSIPESFETGCSSHVPQSLSIVLLPVLSLSYGIMLNADLNQLPGMVLTTVTGQFAKQMFLSEHTLPTDNAVQLIGAMVITAVARIYASTMGNQRPYIYIVAGLLTLVPGGLGVRGMSNMYTGDIASGMEFTFQMVMIGVCLAIGVFIASLPRAKWFSCMFRVSSSSNRSSSRSKIRFSDVKSDMKV